MPADSNQNNQNQQNMPLGQVSSSDAPPLPPEVKPISDASTPRPGKEMGMTETYQAPPAGNFPSPNMPPSPETLQTTPPPMSPVPESPSPMPPMSPGSQNPVSPTMKSSRFPKKIIFIVVGLLLLVLGIVLAAKFLLPRLTNQNSGDGNTPINQTEIVWWGLWEDQQIVAPVINEYQQSHPGIKVTYVPQDKQNYRERLTSSFARGEGPDIFRFHNTWVPMFSQELAPVPSSIMSQQEFSQQYYPVMTRDLLTSKGLVGMPLEIDDLSLFINDDLFTTFGKTPPTTWNEFQELASDMTVRDRNGIITQAGAAIGNAKNVDHWQEILALIMLQNGVNLNNFESLSGPEAAEALKFYTDFVTQSKVWDDTLPTSTIAFSSGKVAMYLAPSWRVFEVQQQNPDLKFRIVPVPQIPKEDPSVPDISYATYWVEGVSEKSKHKDEAWEFLKYVSSKDALQKFYQAASQVRSFGEPYPHPDMRDLLLDTSKVGAFLEYAPTAQSWYLASRTWDGDTGINTRVSQYFEDAVNAMTESRSSGRAEQLMTTVASGVRDVFVQYGLATPVPAPANE